MSNEYEIEVSVMAIGMPYWSKAAYAVFLGDKHIGDMPFALKGYKPRLVPPQRVYTKADMDGGVDFPGAVPDRERR